MRSEILSATLGTQNRFAFCHLLFKAVRKLHKPSERIQDTTNDALQRIAAAEQHQASANPEDENKLAVLEVKVKRGVMETQAGVEAESPASAVNPPDAAAAIPAELIRKAS
jgi:hypothetical protein